MEIMCKKIVNDPMDTYEDSMISEAEETETLSSDD